MVVVGGSDAVAAAAVGRVLRRRLYNYGIYSYGCSCCWTSPAPTTLPPTPTSYGACSCVHACKPGCVHVRKHASVRGRTTSRRWRLCPSMMTRCNPMAMPTVCARLYQHTHAHTHPCTDVDGGAILVDGDCGPESVRSGTAIHAWTLVYTCGMYGTAL